MRFCIYKAQLFYKNFSIKQNRPKAYLSSGHYFGTYNYYVLKVRTFYNPLFNFRFCVRCDDNDKNDGRE